MRAPRVRRFSRFQIAFHWLVAVPYILLLCTGALMMLHRLQLLDWLPDGLLASIHKWIGIGLVVVLIQLLIAGAMGGQLREIVRDVVDWMRFRARDIAWLFMVPLNIIWPGRFHLPPAGRFNAGQKMHGLFIVAALATFAATGIWIMLRPADVRPWLIHSWLFFGAVGFLGLHLFLGLINPPTRRALRGIFTGMVPLRYVKDHHPLTLEPAPAHGRPHAVVSLWAGLGTALVAMALLGGLVWHFGPKRSRAQIVRIAKLDHPMVSPGALAAHHADDPRTMDCRACHQGLQPPTDSACLACHQTIQRVMQERVGFHGTLQGHCRDCHVDHRGRNADLRGLNTRSFNHLQARFALLGAHRKLQCDQCHLQHSGVPGQRRFIGLKFDSCTGCHRNPHDDAKLTDCRRCHNEKGWTGRNLAFDHQRDTGFALEGRHAQLSCGKCHASDRANQRAMLVSITPEAAPLRTIKPLAPASGQTKLAFHMTGVGRRCADCHQDPHRATLGNDCERCHTPAGWTGRNLKFEHDRDTKFRLEGVHAQLRCEQCHKPPSDGAPLALATFAGTPTTCARCHTDPHRGQLGTQCTTCHTQTRFTGRQLLFVHNRDSRFPLRGHHAELSCEKCHRPASAGAALATASFTSTPTECSKCHRDPHQGQMDKSCSACHSEQGWKGKALLFDHNRDAEFKLDAIHSSLSCTACHKPQGQTLHFRPLATSCERCHTQVSDAMAGKVGTMQLAADPHAGRVACTDCHTPGVPVAAPARFAAECARCHTEHYRDLYFDWERSIDDRVARATRAVKLLAQGDPARAGELMQRISAAQRVGMHNVAATVKLLDAVTAEAGGTGGKKSP